jgi:hypothetical protein
MRKKAFDRDEFRNKYNSTAPMKFNLKTEISDG